MQPAQESLTKIEQKLDLNKKEMLRIMKEAPVTGTYAGEDPADWHNFFNFYMDFMKAEIGPRG